MTNKDMLVPNDPTQGTLQFQYDISCQLLDIHLTDLTDDEYSWRPAPKGLHMTYDSGIWRADWPDSESYEIGPPSIAWLTWHITYWWSMVLDHSFGDGTLQHESVPCYGSASEAIDRIYLIKNKWETAVAQLSPHELHERTRTNWPFRDKSFYELLAWLNLELMKNAAEIGYCRFLYASRNRENG
ncbi:DinB family protein [Paenibacillus sp. SC116]|uniref:DinB family protein n=1 Tax=Paenibacillus sp. SC116 TaxID=2968986 RepID=UPI00215AEA8E|nr:DinB family protein [Paenibacillus sp. SC116]MCR8842491.1 DinB family protein [Paenibacillus sp. SC116]